MWAILTLRNYLVVDGGRSIRRGNSREKEQMPMGRMGCTMRDSPCYTTGRIGLCSQRLRLRLRLKITHSPHHIKHRYAGGGLERDAIPVSGARRGRVRSLYILHTVRCLPPPPYPKSLTAYSTV